MIITIDGPSASGKSTIANKLAQRLGFFYLNSGLLYRAFAYAVIHEKHAPDVLAQEAVEDIIALLYYHYHDGTARIAYRDKDITGSLETETIDQTASMISTSHKVRVAINDWQHRLVRDKNAVVDGRDSGSVVFADAAYKFYVTASEDIRVKRWLAKQREQGRTPTDEQALSALRSRDKRDAERAEAPLVVPEGATIIMNDGNDPHAVVEQMVKSIV
jgi:cytidylate kinase